jgi:Transposase DDE domain
MIAQLTRSLNQLVHRLHQRIPSSSPPLTVPLGPFARPRPLPLAHPDLPLPVFVATCPIALKYRELLGDLDWADFPERSTDRPWPGKRPAPRAPVVAAYLVKLHEGKRYSSGLRSFLIEHPALVWLLGFPLVADPSAPHGFDVAASLPTQRQFNRILRQLSNDALQFLLTGTVQLIRATLPPELAASFGDVVAADTKHILAWVKENNPKAYVGEGRYDKTRQPSGDPDCKLGVKSRRNRSPDPDDAGDPITAASPPPTPTTNPQPATQRAAADELYWGYASGVVASKIPGWGEVVLAERTRPFNESDISYFFPLMNVTERRLGRRPPHGAFDCAFDAFYVYEYFETAGGFAAVPLNSHGKGGARTFASDGRPLCAAGLAMPLKFSYMHRSDLIPHQRGKHVCPLLFPSPSGEPCPIADAHFAKGGCTTTIAMSVGARIRWQLNREDPLYKRIFDQRTATERINSQAKELGIERPYLRNQRSISNQNTLIYILINLRLLQRMRAKSAAPAHTEGGQSRAEVALAA